MPNGKNRVLWGHPNANFNFNSTRRRKEMYKKLNRYNADASHILDAPEAWYFRLISQQLFCCVCSRLFVELQYAVCTGVHVYWRRRINVEAKFYLVNTLPFPMYTTIKLSKSIVSIENFHCFIRFSKRTVHCLYVYNYDLFTFLFF